MSENKKKIISVTLVVISIIGFVIYLITNEKSSNINLDDIVENNDKINIEDNEEKAVEDSAEEISKEIVVHITGEVKKEGVVYLKEGARVIDAIEEAGGETKEADLSQVNLAYILQDGQKIYIPNKNEKNSEYITENIGNNVEENSTSTREEGKKVNINTASIEELDQLPGIGPSIAQRIVDYRTEHGKFKTIEEIQDVKGIGDAKYDEIKDNITV